MAVFGRLRMPSLGGATGWLNSEPLGPAEVGDPVTVEADATIGRIVDDVAWTHRFTTYPVLDGRRPVGLLAFASVAAVPRSECDRNACGTR